MSVCGFVLLFGGSKKYFAAMKRSYSSKKACQLERTNLLAGLDHKTRFYVMSLPCQASDSPMDGKIQDGFGRSKIKDV
jgi:hypothetical protein